MLHSTKTINYTYLYKHIHINHENKNKIYYVMMVISL